MHVFHGKLFAVLDGWRERLASIGLDENSEWTTLASEAAVSASFHTTSNFRFTLDDGSSIFFKRYVYNKIRLKHWLQPSKAAVEAAGFHELAQIGIPTLETIAYGEKRFFGLLKAAFIVTRGLDNTIELDQFLARQWFNKPLAAKREILQKIQPVFVQQLQAAHKAGFYHWDLKLRNVLLVNDPERPGLVWIDCPRSRRRSSNDFKAMVTDLAAAARVGCRVLTQGQRMRFLLDYTENDKTLARELYKAVSVTLAKRPPRPFWQLLSMDDPVYIRHAKQYSEPGNKE